MNVLSLFDGMSCGQIALRELGIPIDNYYASEVDKFAIAQTQLNFPNTVQLGDVRNVHAKDLPKIDLLIGGFCCQSFSIAGKMRGFNDERGELFFEYVRILNELRDINPDIKFFAENVRMKKKYEAVITEQLGVQPVMINSALVSAQNRVRLYWSNIRTRAEGLFGEVYTDIPQPEDRGILIEDILEREVDEKYYLSEKLMLLSKNDVKQNEHANYIPGAIVAFGKETHFRPVQSGKSPCLMARARQDGSGQPCVIQLNPCTESQGRQPYQQNRVYDISGKTPALCAGLSALNVNTPIIRRLTPTECARLQTIPSWYKWGCSDTQQYKMLGNGWTVEVIKHIFSFLDLHHLTTTK